jgi:hypothetical protein
MGRFLIIDEADDFLSRVSRASCLLNEPNKPNGQMRVIQLGQQREYGSKLQYCKPDNHIKGTPEHTTRMDLMICLGKKSNPTQEVPYETIIRGFRSAWQQQFGRNH